MRKSNKIVFGIASVLLSATMLTTSAISTTFAKYVTRTDDFSDSARVAKWGGEIEEITASKTAVKMKPGEQGELVRIKTKGVPEVAHLVDLDAVLNIDSGYRKINKGEDYFPILITVGVEGSALNVNGKTTTNHYKHFYMTMTSSKGNKITTVDALIEEIKKCAAGTEFSNISVAPGENKPLEFYVNWQWFYDDAAIDASSLDSTIKTALKAYQNPELDTLIGESMRIRAAFDAILADGGRSNLQQLKDVLRDTENKSSDALTANDVTALSNALADVLGETATEYTYTRQEAYNIRWRGIINSQHRKVYDPDGVVTAYGAYWTPDEITDDYMYTPINPDTGASLVGSLGTYASVCFYSVPERDGSGKVIANGATIPLVDGYVYEYNFKAKNTKEQCYAGVVFATDANDIPYFLYGAFTNNASDDGTKAEISIGKDRFPHPATTNPAPVYAVGGSSSNKNYNYEVDFDVATDSEGYGIYKIVYEGFNVKCYYKNTSGKYVQFGNTITLPKGSRFSVGVLSRFGTGNNERTVQITGANFVQEKAVVSIPTTYATLKSRAEAVIAACENGPFDVQANLTVTMKQSFAD